MHGVQADVRDRSTETAETTKGRRIAAQRHANTLPCRYSGTSVVKRTERERPLTSPRCTTLRSDTLASMSKAPPSDALVFFGATGDLAYKKIFPALQSLVKRGRLDVPIVGVAKSGWSRE